MAVKSTLFRLWPMPASKPGTKLNQAKTFEAVLERTPDRLRWVDCTPALDAAKTWGKRGQLRIKGEINGFAFSSTLFPVGDGRHFLIVNKKLLSGEQGRPPGLTAKFRLQLDTAPRPATPPAKELLHEAGAIQAAAQVLQILHSL